MPYPEDSYSEPDEPGGGYAGVEADPATCPGCGADLRAVGLVEREPTWVIWHWRWIDEGAGRFRFRPTKEYTLDDNIAGFDSNWRCGACGAGVAAPDLIEEGEA